MNRQAMRLPYNRRREPQSFGRFLTDDSAPGLFDKVEDQLDFLRGRQLASNSIDCLAGIIFRPVNDSKSFLNQFNRFRRNAFALHAYQIDTSYLCRVTIRYHEWRNILD